MFVKRVPKLNYNYNVFNAFVKYESITYPTNLFGTRSNEFPFRDMQRKSMRDKVIIVFSGVK